jgi:hypothetical protein
MQILSKCCQFKAILHNKTSRQPGVKRPTSFRNVATRGSQNLSLNNEWKNEATKLTN